MSDAKERKAQVIKDALAEIVTEPREALLDKWRDVIGPPPKHVSTSILRRAFAYELQLSMTRAPSKRTLAMIERIAAGKKVGAVRVAASLKTGNRLMREWNGKTWQVEVLEDGYLMEGTHYRSLSAAAKEITGAHWSGPRFFGLEVRKSSSGGNHSERACA